MRLLYPPDSERPISEQISPWSLPGAMFLLGVAVLACAAAWRRCTRYERRSLLGCLALCAILMLCHGAVAWLVGGWVGALYAALMAGLIGAGLSAIVCGVLAVLRWDGEITEKE